MSATYEFDKVEMACGHVMQWPHGIERAANRRCNQCLVIAEEMTQADVDRWWAQWGVPREQL